MPCVRVCAHRGCSSTHPENTLPALRAAVALGCEQVEFDVRLSADGCPVLMHDHRRVRYLHWAILHLGHMMY
jgi:glycerophosphoryl diester phosphodiesterase